MYIGYAVELLLYGKNKPVTNAVPLQEGVTANSVVGRIVGRDFTSMRHYTSTRTPERIKLPELSFFKPDATDTEQLLHTSGKDDVVPSEPTSEQTFQIPILVLTVAGWFLHAFVWGLLFRQYYKVFDIWTELNPGSAALSDGAQTAITFVFWTQMFWFSTFGLVQLLQIFQVSDTIFSVDGEESDDMSSGDKPFFVASYLYAILSVSSKLILEIGFIWTLAGMPQTEYHVQDVPTCSLSAQTTAIQTTPPP